MIHKSRKRTVGLSSLIIVMLTFSVTLSSYLMYNPTTYAVGSAYVRVNQVG